MSAGIIKTQKPRTTKRDIVKKQRPNVVLNKFPEKDCTEFNRPTKYYLVIHRLATCQAKDIKYYCYQIAF